MKSLRFWPVMPVVAIVSACSSGSGTGNGNGTPDAGSGEGGSGDGGSCALTCEVAAPSNGGFLTDYCCPDQSSVDTCSKDVVPCTPTNRTRGKVQPGFVCNSIAVNPSGASMNELGDDCAPIAKYASATSPKGTYCLNQISSGRTYCSHDCMADADCADLDVKAFCPIASGQTSSQCTLPGG